MIQTGFEKRVKVQQIIESQLPEFILSESPKTVDFLKQYYISQEYQGGPSDLSDNLDQYLKLDNLTPEVIVGETTLSSGISSTTDTVQVATTKGFPLEYGLFQINDEIFTYTGITTNSFTGCIRGFCGITSYRTDLDSEELIFENSSAASHAVGSTVENLSTRFLKEFYNKLKYSFTPGLENVDFVSNLDVNNFIKEARSLYESKGTEESYKILFKVLYGVDPQVIDLEDYLVKPSAAEYRRREVIIAERVSGDPKNLVGQTITKSTDSETKASVSEVEIFTRSGISTYYKLGLFVGFDDRDLIEGTFEIQPSTKVISAVSVGSSVVTVDSTVGFADTGKVISGRNTIEYKGKTVNQFLGCSGIGTVIPTKTDLRTDEVFFGYENGDTTKKVELRITGVLSEFEPVHDILLTTEGERIYTKNVGEKILNPETDKTDKEIFANSWIYNTSSRFDVESISGSTFQLKSELDKSSLKVGDNVDILNGTTETVLHSNAVVASINASNKQITLNNLSGFTASSSVIYTIRRKLNTTSSSGTGIFYGNSTVTSDVQNVYTDRSGSAYVASNSLPSYDITENVLRATIASASGSALQGYNSTTEKYSILSFGGNVPFITGDEVYYTYSSSSLTGLTEGYYYVKVLPLANQIKLYASRSLIVSDNPVEFTSSSASGSHTFTLSAQKSGYIYPQKLLKKFPLNRNVQNGNDTPTLPASTGMLVNGVEIINYKSTDKIYSGPVESVRLYNGGTNYDVISPPDIEIASPGTGYTTALVRSVVEGNVKEVKVDPQDFDLVDVLSVTIDGGNGSGAILEPVLETRYREIEFDARLTAGGGGVSNSDDTITFLKPHNLRNGDAIVYNRNGNNALGVGTFGGSNAHQDLRLNSGSVYYAQIVNSSTIKLYETFENYASGISTVGLTTTSQGIQKFRMFEGKKTLKSVKVINPGSGYQNRQLKVKSENISTVEDSITFKNHGFADGDVVVYTSDGSVATGLTTSVRYKVLKVSDDTFKLANAGVGATNLTNYTKRLPVSITGVGTGFQNFAYPDVSISVNAEFDGVSGVITATPVVRGEIVDLYLYETGTGYGTTILNFHKRPDIKIKNGKNAELKPLISGGSIVSVQVTNGGSEYTSAPDLKVVGDGVGARLRAMVSGGKVTNVVVLNSGVGYAQNTTSVTVTPAGRNGSVDASVRALTLNNHHRFGDEILLDNNGELEYGVVGYTTSIGDSEFGDDGTSHSPIIGWAYDGNPIYGAYAYSDPADINSGIKVLTSGYQRVTADIVDRPVGFAAGFFVEDYKFTSSGDLDEHNGRYAKTPEFPNGVYSYHVGITSDGKNSQFPYFLGHTYRSVPVIQNLDQGYDFNNSTLTRNTFPYKVGDAFANNDFISESYETLMQSAVIDSITKGSVDGFTINEPGSNYRVNDVSLFDNTETNGGGLAAYVERVTGKPITDVTTSIQTYQSNVLVWDNANQVSVHVSPSHTFLENDQIAISGLSTFVPGLTKLHKIGVTSESTKLVGEVAANSTVGFVTDIFVINIPSTVAAGTTVAIGTERMSVLATYPQNKVIRVVRGITGSAHTAFTDVFISPNRFTLPVRTSYFNSGVDDKVYFNPIQSVGIGTTTGSDSSRGYFVGDRHRTVSVPIQSVYLPNHPFRTGQQVTFERIGGSQGFTVSNTETSATFSIPQSGNSETLFVVKKSGDFIGLCTQVGLTTNTEGLYFRNITANGDSTDYRYSLTSNKVQVTARAEKIKARVSVSTAHGLTNGDTIKLSLNSEQSVGVGTSVSAYLKYNSTYDRLLVNPIGFNSTSVNSSTNELTLVDHGLNTGDKVFYNASDLVVSGLSTGSYFVYRIDDDTINLSPTHYDSISTPPTVVSFASTGGSSQELSRINPQLEVVRDNNLVFNVSDTSLSGYTLKLFYDREFKNELVSIGSSTTFSTSGVGTVGVTTTATFTLNYNKDLPSKVYYQLDKAGFISSADTEVKNYNEILFADSRYNGTYTVSGIGSTTFDISLGAVPEDLQYNQSDTSVLKYSTSSPRALGGVDSMRITFGGANYKKLPRFVSIASSIGENADIIPTSTTLGRINQVTIQDPGFDFSADKTLNPEVYISPNITVVNRNSITSIDVTSGGSGYTSVPDLVIVNPSTGTAYDTGLVIAKVQGSSISSVEILESPKGISEVESEIYAINNSNGVGINSIFSSPAGIVTCVLSTPVSGFTTATAPFAVGDFVFAESISLASTTGTGFNSADYAYNFFKVTAYRNTNPAEVEFDISPYATNAGVADTSQNSFAFLVNKNNYPVFNVTQEAGAFIIGETLFTKSGTTYTERDLVITDNLNDSIKVYGTYTLSENQVIVGKDSGTVATIKSITENKGIFKVNYGLETDYGWATDTGKLDEDYQVLPDNDYYQNLSYSIKSPIEYEDWVDPVNRLLHSSGLKNFADTGITSEGKVSVATSTTSTSTALIDLISERRVDTVNFFDFGIDVDVTSNKSKFVKLQNTKLADYIECRTNRVLTIDNFNDQFSNAEDANTTLYRDIDSFIANDGYSRYFVQIINPNNNNRQATELIVLNTPSDELITVEKGSIYNSADQLADLQAIKDSFGNVKLRFTPADPYNSDYDVKFIKNNFNTTLTGINTQSVGFINLIGSNITVGSGNTSTVYEATTVTTESVFAIVELTDTITKDKTVVDMFIDHDGTDTYKSDFFFDNNAGSGISNNFIGTFISNISSGVLSLKFENTESNDVLVRSRVVGFGTTAAGIGTHIFKVSGQPDVAVREGRLEANYSVFSGTGISTVLTYLRSDVTTVKSTARVSYGNTSALHQVLFNHNNNNAFTMQYPFISIGSTSGIGTFGSKVSGNNLDLVFYPDSNINNDITVQLYSEVIQTEKDLLNIPAVLSYGTVNEKLVTAQFDSINGDRTNKFDFELKHNGTPIFEKQFNPGISTVVNLGTGVFTISDHFFSTGERLIYTPRTTFVGGAYTSMVMSDTNVLPTDVYAIKINNNEFKLATSQANANAGTAVTFSSAGSGNGHTLEMFKKLEKSLITIDGVGRAPLAYTPVNHTLSDNGGSISVGATYFGISGISSIIPGDVLKIDNEYMKVDAVGLGTTTIGPITGSGSFNVVKTERGFVGTLATTHTDGATVRLYQGSYNMTRSQIHFTEAPRGNTQELVDESNIPYTKSTFGGRVYLRQDYSTNQIYDNITRQFTGIGATYRLTVGGANTTGIETGSGLVFINNMFQTPTTSNNVGGNYSFIENAGISSVVFTGVNNASFISDYDVNQNLLPRGGLIVSLGSTQGLGFAPLVGASVTAFVSGGVIQSVGLGSTDIVGSGYRGTVSIGVTDPNHSGNAATITATVGAGGTLSFTVSDGGSGYSSNPVIEIPEPNYENLSVVGVSRLGIGATTDTGSGLLLNVEVGAATTNVGIGSTLFEVTNFKITRPGWGFRKGDKFKPVGLVTARHLAAPINDFEIEVLEVFDDNFAAWQFGQLDYIDSIASLQNGTRKRFPLNYNGELVSFETDPDNVDSAAIDLESLLLIYVNGVLQDPNIHYNFEGGTSITFTTAPTSNDNIDIFFYMGTRDVDSITVDINETIKVGDIIQLQKTENSLLQDPRTIYNINASDKVETNIYSGLGIDDANYKPFSWTKQKVDKNLGGELIYKSRDSIESQVYPTAKIIGDLSTSATEIFVDDAQFFNYEENESSINITSVNGLIVNTTTDPVAAAITAVVSAAGTISSFTITSGGSGYVGASTDVKISAPKAVGVGVGTTATATATITNGSISALSITNAGFGYTHTAPPQVLTSFPKVSVENLSGITAVAGFAGTVTGIGTTVGTGGNALALKFTLNASSFTGLQAGYPIYVFNTSIGSGVTSINGSDSSVVGIGTSFLDNVYIINDFHSSSTTGVATCNILSTTSVAGLSTSGSATDPRGYFSWGRLSGFSRSSSPVSIAVTGLTVDSGLSTFPTIQRRGYGLRDGGALRKDLG
jgi:hypothetical protein